MLFLGIGHPPTPPQTSSTLQQNLRRGSFRHVRGETPEQPPRPRTFHRSLGAQKRRGKNIRKTGLRDPSRESPLPNHVRLRRRLLEVWRQPILESSCKTRCLPQPQRTKEKSALAKGWKRRSERGGAGGCDSKSPELWVERRGTYLALLINPVHLSPPGIPALQLNSRFRQPHPQRIRSFPSVVMWDLAVYVMCNVRLGDPMGERRR